MDAAPKIGSLSSLRQELLGFVRRRVPEDDAEDLAQEILERVLRNAAALRDNERLGAWIHRVAVNATTDYYRRRARRLRHEHELGEEPAKPDDADAAPAVRARLSACLRPMMERLDHKYAQALQWVELDGMTQADAARRAGISVSGMKSRVQRARGLLKKEFVRCCSIELDARKGIVDCHPRGGRC